VVKRLPSCVRKWSSFGLVEVVCEAVVVMQGEGAERLFQPWTVAPSTRGAVLAGTALFGGALPGTLVFNVSDRQPQLDHGVVAGEMPAVVDDLAQLVVSDSMLFVV